MNMSSTVVGDTTENTCVVCFKNVTIYSVGECDHPVCYECSTRMRVLCRQNECPICRQDMPKVIFTMNVQPFKNISNNLYLMDKKFKICFDNAEIQAAYNKLLEHVCPICPGRPAFRTFVNLKDHMRKEHELHYCDLCVDNLKIFTAERKCYTRQELAQHRRKGDPDDKSHRGHPLCEFCDQRYMDNDELFRHLRRDHLFCHFCDADGYHQYYSSYDYLREHFRVDHFLCEEGSCVDEKFTSAFRTEIDLKAHRASVHGRSMGKAAAKQARTLEVEFTLAPRARPGTERGGGRGGGAGSRGGGGAGPRGRGGRDDEAGALTGAAGPTFDDVAPVMVCPAAPSLRASDFPTLNGGPGAPPSVTPLATPNGLGGVTIRATRQQPLAVTDENFPALGGGAEAAPPFPVPARAPAHAHAPSRTFRLSVNSDRVGDGVSIRVNRRERPTSSASLLSADNFPSLSRSSAAGPAPGPGPGPKPAAPAPTAGQWLQLDRRGRQRPAPTPATDFTPETKSVDEEFPRLASSVVIPVTPASTRLRQPQARSERPANAVPRSRSPAPAPKLPEPSLATAAAPVIKVKSKKKKQQQQQQQQQQTSVPAKTGAGSGPSAPAPEGSSKEAGKRKKRDDAPSTPRSTEEEITSKLEGILMSRDERRADGPSKKSGGGDRGGGGGASAGSGGDAESTPTTPGTNGGERKLSELYIGALHSTGAEVSENSAVPAASMLEDSLTPGVGAVGCPPGFARSVAFAPPPGFTGPPPGFNVTLNSVARPSSMTFTSSSGRSYSIPPRTTASSSFAATPVSIGASSVSTNGPRLGSSAVLGPFVAPRDADRRNAALAERVQRATRIEDFMQLSALFRQGALPARDFHLHTRALLGRETFAEIFPELLVLLPDVQKQQELLAAHQADNDVAAASLPVETCLECGQVLAPADVLLHQRHHHQPPRLLGANGLHSSSTVAAVDGDR